MKTEIIGNATLYLGDCREILPTLPKIDAIITDPVWPNCPPSLLIGGTDPYGLFSEFCSILPNELARLVVILRNDSDPRFLSPIPRRLKFLQAMWCDYAIPGYYGRVLGGNEIAYVFGEPIEFKPGQQVIPSRSPRAQPGDLNERGLHPCPRSKLHMKFIVRWQSNEDEVVCDPFAGIGTTGIACILLGRKFIGIEIEPKYFDIACRRIEAADRQKDLFINSRPAEEAIPLPL